MSHYIAMYCEHHGDWEMDVDNLCECPTCEASGMTEVQTLRARLAAAEARVAELEGNLLDAIALMHEMLDRLRHLRGEEVKGGK